MSDTMKAAAELLDSKGLPHGLDTGNWSEWSGVAFESPRVLGGLELTLNGRGSEKATILCRNECAPTGGQVLANLHGTGCLLVLDTEASKRSPMVVLHVFTRNALIYLNMNDLRPVEARPLRLEVTFYNGENQLFYWGEGASSVETRCVVDGNGRAVVVGRDAMLANGIYLRTHDGHALVDLASREILNPGGDVEIGPHVWLAQETLVVGPASIGPGAVIGAKSLVKGSIPGLCVAAGVPAKVIRDNVSWGRLPNNLHHLDHELKGL